MSDVTRHLQERGVRFRVLPHARTTSAVGEALALGLDPEEVAKAVLLDAADGHVLAVVPASARVDVDLVQEALGDRHVHLASELEVALDFPEYDLGALPPLPGLLGIPVVIDPAVLAHHRITFAGGTCDESVEAETDDVLVGESVTIAPITRPADVDQRLLRR